MFKDLLIVYDAIFSSAMVQSGHLGDDDIVQLKEFVVGGMHLWRELQLIATEPNPRAVEGNCSE
jgi:hypothetical protein